LLAQQGAFLASQQHPPLQFQQQYLQQATPAAFYGQQGGTSAPPGSYNPPPGLPAAFDQASLASTFSTMTLQQPPNTDRYFDSGATSHMTSDSHTLSHPKPLHSTLLLLSLSVMALYFLSPPLASPLSRTLCPSIMFLSHHASLRTLFLCANSPLTKNVLLNLTLLVVL
jgi:hypothetical protein